MLDVVIFSNINKLYKVNISNVVFIKKKQYLKKTIETDYIF